MKKTIFTRTLAVLSAVSVLASSAGCTAKSQTGEADASKATAAEIIGVSEGDSGFKVELEQTDDEREQLIAAHTTQDGRTFVNVAVEADPGTLSPFGSGVGKVQHVIRNALFETAMVYVLADAKLEPYLASGYEQVDDVTYDVFFKDYIYDTEGNHLTAEDVVFSWLCGRDDWNSGNMSFIEKAEAIDTYTVRITMKSARVGTFEKVLYEGWIFTKAAYAASPDTFITTPVGTSQYRLVKWETGSGITLEKTNDYWEKDHDKFSLIQEANVDVINYKIITEEAQRVIAMQTGEVDMIHKVDFTNLEAFNNDNYTVFSTLNNQIMQLMFNCSEYSPCGDVRVRQAICYAIDAAGILDVVCSGQGEVAWATATEGSMDAYETWKDRDFYGQDVEKARALLAEAGYGAGNPVKVKLMYETTDKNAPTAEILQAYLMDVGIEVEMFPCEGATYSTYKYGSTEFDMHMGSVGGLEPYCITAWWDYKGSGIDDKGNVIALDDAEMTRMIEECYDSVTHDEEHMTATFHYITDNAYVYPLYRYMLYTITSNIYSNMNLRCGGREIAPQYCRYIWNE